MFNPHDCVQDLDKVTTGHEKNRKNTLKLFKFFDMSNATLARKEQIQNYYKYNM